jgi:ferrous iron transport protein A
MGTPSLSLADLPVGGVGIIRTLEMDQDSAHRLMELGFVPGAHVAAVGRAPGGDPLVFRVDGSEIALRRETAARLRLASAE